jgi:hypothetical protein
MDSRIRAGWPTLVAVSAALAGAPAAAQAAGEWQFAESAESCRASRSFDTAAGSTTLQLRSFGPGSAVEVTVAGPEVPRDPNKVRMVELGWDGAGFDKHQAGILGTLADTPSVSLLTAHRAVSPFAFYFSESAVAVSHLDPTAESMQLRVVGNAPRELRMGSLVEPLRRLEECEARLMDKWGWGADYFQRVATPPTMRDPQRWFFTAIIYPAVPNLSRVSSFLQLRLRVDTSGKVAECAVQSSPGSSQFGEKNCSGLRRHARFDPARDAQGQPVESYFQMSITFARYD